MKMSPTKHKTRTRKVLEQVMYFGAAAVFYLASGAMAQSIAVTGETADGKYKTYDLKGGLDDLKYYSDGFLYKPDDLVGRLPWLADKDTKTGIYACSFVCKDEQGRIVGLNPAWRWMQEKQKQ